MHLWCRFFIFIIITLPASCVSGADPWCAGCVQCQILMGFDSVWCIGSIKRWILQPMRLCIVDISCTYVLFLGLGQCNASKKWRSSIQIFPPVNLESLWRINARPLKHFLVTWLGELGVSPEGAMGRKIPDRCFHFDSRRVFICQCLSTNFSFLLSPPWQFTLKGLSKTF